MEPALGPLSVHMLEHVVLMNVLIPLVIFATDLRIPAVSARSWPYATVLQLVLFWGWHSPPVLDAVMHHGALMGAMHVTLAGAAFWFWMAVKASRGTQQWRAMVALLVTGKLFCLLGALLVFAPRMLFTFDHPASNQLENGLADQQLAGLIMLTACPLTYVIAGIVISARWFLALEADGTANA